jgi:hypothetical protein
MRVPTYLVTTPGKLLGLSLPARVALTLAFFLILCTLIVVVVFSNSEDKAHVEVLKDLKWIVPVLAILILAPLVAYYAVRLWLVGDESRYPKIDAAWNAGMAALKENGIDIRDCPLYLVLGLPDAAECTALFAASRIKMIVSDVPQGKSPLHWYASDEAIYLACPGMGCLGSLNQLAARGALSSGPEPTSTLMPGETPANRPNPIEATLVLGGAPADRSSLGGSPQPEPARSPTLDARYRTLVPGDISNQPAGSTHAAPQITNQQKKDCLERLEYVFQRLRRVRQPYCANNGVLTILPHSVFRDILFSKDLSNAVRQDLATLRHSTQLSSPVTTLVTGMEAEPGFSELALRVGLDRARKSRFGKGFAVWNKASDENLDALSSHACGAFEDHIYEMFKAGDGFDNPTNGNLYAMLCRLRQNLQPKLRGALVHGCSEKTENGNQVPVRFGGCYFAATGSMDEEQVFVRSVFDKLDELCSELQWSDAAYREDASYLWIARLFTVVNYVLAAGVVYLAFRMISN